MRDGPVLVLKVIAQHRFQLKTHWYDERVSAKRRKIWSIRKVCIIVSMRNSARMVYQLALVPIKDATEGFEADAVA